MKQIHKRPQTSDCIAYFNRTTPASRTDARYELIELLKQEQFYVAMKKGQSFLRKKIITRDDFQFVKEIVFLANVRRKIS